MVSFRVLPGNEPEATLPQPYNAAALFRLQPRGLGPWSMSLVEFMSGTGAPGGASYFTGGREIGSGFCDWGQGRLYFAMISFVARSQCFLPNAL